MPPFRIQLFGNLQVFCGSELLPAINTNRLQSLLAYVVLHDAPQSREHLAFLLWPESSESQARTNLRQLLHHLRRALSGCGNLLADHQTVEWRRDANCSFDFLEFHDAVARGDAAGKRGDSPARIQAFEEAAALYQDELLRGLYDEWIQPIRERYGRQLAQVLGTLAVLYEERGEYPSAIRQAERLVAQDPLRETHYQLLIRLHAVNHDRAGALRAYHQCMRTLRRELAVEPGTVTRELFERLLKSPPVSAPRAELPASATAAALPMIGRKKEWERLLECWRSAANGPIRMAVLLGEPGIGKSRLAEELYEWCARHQGAVARARCYAAQGQLAYAPVTEWLRGEPMRQACTQLVQQQLGELARVLPEILSENPALGRPRPLTESWERHHFYEALNAAFSKARKPLLLLVDDLQWCDQDSFEWLHSLFRSGMARQILVLGTARPEETGRNHPFMRLLNDLRQSGQVDEFPLSPLDVEETAALATQVADRRLDAARLDGLYRDTKGNPLFVLESLRAESAGIAAAPRIHAVIAARLAQLSATAYELAGLAGAIGQSFSFDLLAKATDWDEDSLSRALDELWQRRIVEAQGQAHYDFTHDRLREVAYTELSPVRRRFLHRRIAQALEELHGSEPATVSGQMAAHYEAAGMGEPAIRHYRAAASVAHQRYADAEAAGLLHRALTLCMEFPETSRRDEQELELRVELGNALVTSQGYAFPEVGEAYKRALLLSRKLGERKHAFAVLHGLWVFHIVRGELETARELSEQTVAMASTGDEAGVSIGGLFTLGGSLFHLGRLQESEDHMRRTLAAFQGGPHHALRLFTGPDTETFCRSYLAHVLWHLGSLDQATAQNNQALAKARDAGDPFGLAIALNYAAMLHVFQRENQPALALAEESVALCREHQFVYYRSMGEILAGWARAAAGDAERGVAQIREGLDSLKATGAELRLPFYHGLMAEACAMAGRSGDAMAHISNAFAFQSKNGELWILADLHRIHGDLLLRGGDAALARASYRKAMEAARQTGARSIELRAIERLESASERP